jgi:anti-anti-sigma factor
VVYSLKLEVRGKLAIRFRGAQGDAMTVHIEFHDSVADIILSGNIDYSTQEEIRNASQQAVSTAWVREIHVDFAEVDFLDSSVIRALLILQKEARAKGKSLVILNCNQSTRELFEIGGFDRMFTFG